MDIFLAIEHNLILHSLCGIIENYDFVDRVVALDHVAKIRQHYPIASPSVLLASSWQARENKKAFPGLMGTIMEVPLVVMVLSTDPNDNAREFESGDLYDYIPFNAPFQTIEEKLRKFAVNNARGEVSYIEKKPNPGTLAALSKRTGLTGRELQILYLICKEYSSEEIGTMLMLKRRTIEANRRVLFHKLGCNSVLGFVKYALKHRLFPDFRIPG